MENKGNIPHFPMKSMVYPLVMTNIAIEAMSIEIVDLPIENGGSFHRFLYVYQRVTVKSPQNFLHLSS